MTDLTAHDIEQGFERHLRTRVRHTFCGTVSDVRMSDALDFAVKPFLLQDCWCCVCGRRLPVAQFVWMADGEPVGS